MRIRLGKKTEMILLCLVGDAYITTQLLDMMLMGGRSGSYKRAHRRLYGGSAFPELPEAIFSNEQQFYNLLNKLKNQGLVDLRQKGIINYVHIFEISKVGTIKEVI